MNQIAEGIMTGIAGTEAAKERRAPKMQRIYAAAGMPEMSYQGGGIAEGFDSPNARPDEAALTQGVAAAVAGKLSMEEAQMALMAYQEAYGEKALEALIDQIGDELDRLATEAQGPNSTPDKGLLRGPGGGTDDAIPGQVAETGQPIAVSAGEYVVPADAVKFLSEAQGDGSVEDGGRILDETVAGIRQAVNGSPKQDKRVAQAAGLKM